MLKNPNSIISTDFIIFTILSLRYIVTVSQESPSPLFYTAVLISIFVYAMVDYFNQKKSSKTTLRIKTFSFMAIVILLIYVPTLYIIFERNIKNDIYFTSDGAIIAEVGARGLLQGKNPYEENFEHALKDWPYQRGEVTTNPTNTHYPYLPFFTIINSAAYLPLNGLLGFFDIRMVSLLMLSLTIFMIFAIAKEKSNKFLFATLILFNPLHLPNFLWGLNDIYVYSLFIAGVFAAKLNKISLFLIFLALAIGIKHSAWPILPFALYYLYLQEKGRIQKRLKNLAVKLIPFAITLFLIFTPSVTSNPKEFWEDTWLFNNGGLETSTTIGGFGFSETLVFLQIIKERTANFPLFVFQIASLAFLLPFLLKLQQKNNSLSQIVFNYAILLLVLWFFSRNLNQNYLAYISMIITTAAFI